MLDKAISFISYLDSFGYESYIVGGFVRDYLLGIDSTDIDICTSATPKDLKNIFTDLCLPRENYGSVVIMYKNTRFEVTTFRKDLNYVNNRKPSEVVYVKDLRVDLERRDFTINSICMDKDKNIIDLVNGRKDLSNKIINSVGDASFKFMEDALRILRAIRFATTLDFDISSNVDASIRENSYLLKNLSYTRIRSELDKIFTSNNPRRGVMLLDEYNILKLLNIERVKYINDYSDLLGIWAYIDNDNYIFTKNERNLINSIKTCIKIDNLDKYNLYKYELYPNLVAGTIKGISKSEIASIYSNLPIKNRKDICVNNLMICDILCISPSGYLKDIMDDLEKEIVLGNINNNYDDISNYLINKYK